MITWLLNMSELEKINNFLLNKYNNNENKINIINFFQSFSINHNRCRILQNLLENYKKDNINNKEYYKNNILGDIKKIYTQYKRDNLSSYGQFITKLLEIINDEINGDSYMKEPEIPKIKKKKFSLTKKKIIWNTYFDEQIGKAKCYCCNITEIVQISFNCGHVISEANGGTDNIDNLRPICQSCNSSMGTKNMFEFMESLK